MDEWEYSILCVSLIPGGIVYLAICMCSAVWNVRSRWRSGAIYGTRIAHAARASTFRSNKNNNTIFGAHSTPMYTYEYIVYGSAQKIQL